MSLRLLWLLIPGLLLCEGKKKKDKAAVSAKDDKAGWAETTNDEGKVVQQLKIEAPSMTEEDQYGYTMPDRYKCDSCRAIMFHLDTGLKKVHPKSRRMKQWEYTDAFDEACRSSFEGYGIKLVRGENTLSGPGLTHSDQLEPGSGAIQMGGETWSKRLSEACRVLVYEKMGEDALYDKFREDGGLSEKICYSDLRDCVTGPQAPPKPKEEPPAEKPKKEKKEKKDKMKALRDYKEKKRTTTMSKSKADKAEPPKSGKKTSDERMDSQTFLRKLAQKQGLSADEYLVSRTEREWEKLIVSQASRIFHSHSQEL